MPCEDIGSLEEFIEEGLTAIPQADQNKLNLEGLLVECSANIDEGLEESEPNANRWDYFICVRKKRRHIPIYVEVHAVSADELPKLLKKLTWLREKIKDQEWPIEDGVPFFVAGSNSLLVNSPQYRQLAENRVAVLNKGSEVVKLVS